MIDFVDVHHGEGAVNWSLLRQNAKGAIVKAGDGYMMPKVAGTPQSPPKDYSWHYDPRFVENWNGANGMQLRGAYWFLRLNHEKRPWDADAGIERQAQMFTDLLKQNDFDISRDEVVADVEQSPDQIAYLNQTVKRTRVKVFLNLVEMFIGKRPIIYTYPSWWESQIGIAGWELDYKLWIADYTPPTWIPKPWTSIWAHQYTDDGKIAGISGAADLNRFGADYKPPSTPQEQLSLEERVSKPERWVNEHGGF